MLSIFPASELRERFDHYCDKLSADYDFGKVEAIQALGKLKKKDDQARAVIQIGIIIGGADGNFDEDALLAARAAKRFFDYGVEPRHLKMYKQFADREVAFFEQIVSPVTRRRDPSARGEADTSLRELAGLARQMREASFRSSFRELLGS